MLPVKTTLLPSVSRFFGDDWNKLFDWSDHNYNSLHSNLALANIHENADNYIIELAVPGMHKDDFKIELKRNVLTVSSNSSSTEESKNEQYTLREFGFNSFERSFNLNPKLVDDTKIHAKYENGILSLSIAKKEEAKERPARFIEIA